MTQMRRGFTGSRDIQNGRPGRRFRLGAALLCPLLALAACEEPDPILEGERIDVRKPSAPEGFVEYDPASRQSANAVDAALTLPAPVQLTEWTHRAARPNHFAPHAALRAGPELAWSADIGTGNSRQHRITGQPVVSGGRVFVMDSQSQVTAVDAMSGEEIWTVNLTPPEERRQDASGGGVAVSGNRVYATTGFGEVMSIDAGSGAIVWRQALNAPATAAPTVSGGLVYAVARDNHAWAIDAETGRVRWDIPGTPDVSGVIGGASPAVAERVVIFPFGSGELVAAFRQGGVRLWGSSVSGKREGAAYANITDITADPVVVDNVVYTGNQSGRAVALNLSSGTRLWTAREGAFGPVAVAGNSVFMLTDRAELVRLSKASGQRIWGADLPFLRDEKAKRAKAIFAHYGPILAGGALWVASDDGALRSYDPATGEERARLEIPGGAASSMAVANGTMYLISSRGELLAYR